MERRYSVERLTLVSAGVAGIALGLLDLVGLLEYPVLQRNMPKITLLLVGMTLTLLATAALSRLSIVVARTKELEAAIVRQGKINQSAITTSLIAQLPAMLHQIDPAILRVFRPYLEEVFRTPPRILIEKRFRLENLESYRSYHRRTLEENPGHTFLATSLPYRKWFWRSDHLERAMGDFIAGGGKIERIFFLPDGDASLAEQEVQDVMSIQSRLGVRVFTLDANRVPADLRRFFFVESGGSFGWEAMRGPDDQVVSLEVTADRNQTAALLARFEQLKKQSAYYTPGRFVTRQIGALDGSQLVNIAKDPEAFREFEYLGWQNSVERYHAAWSGLTGQAARPMLEALGVSAGTTFLDVASGPGYLAEAARRAGADAVGLDFSPAMLEKGGQANPGVAFRLGDAQELPFDSESFDAVGMNFGMLHLAEPEAAVREAYRVLRHGGRFAFTVWAPPSEAQAFALVLKAVEQHGEHVTIPHGPDFFFYSQPDESKTVLTTVGFAAANVVMIELEWRLADPADVFPSFLHGTARTGGLLRQQNHSARTEIERAVTRSAARFGTAGGGVVIPMPAVLACGVKH